MENRETFFKRLPGLTPDETFRLSFAYDIAKEGHGYLGQMRDGGERYFEHVRAVALILIDVFAITDVDIIIAALFHDLPEDVHIWKVPGRISHVFGKDIGAMAHALAKPEKKDFSSKEAHLDFYFRKQLIPAGWKVCLIKIADRLHNLSTMNGVWDTDKIEKYIFETKKYFYELIKIIEREDSFLAQQAKSTLDNSLSSLLVENKN